MKTFAKLTAFMLCLMTMSLTACSDDDDDDNNNAIVGTWEAYEEYGRYSYHAQMVFRGNGTAKYIYKEYIDGKLDEEDEEVIDFHYRYDEDEEVIYVTAYDEEESEEFTEAIQIITEENGEKCFEIDGAYFYKV